MRERNKPFPGTSRLEPEGKSWRLPLLGWVSGCSFTFKRNWGSLLQSHELYPLQHIIFNLGEPQGRYRVRGSDPLQAQDTPILGTPILPL